jgi:hypothetical protein
MRVLRPAIAVVYGFTIFYFIWVWLGGFMAARQVPGAFFRLVGQEPALALISFGFHFLPTVCLLALFSLLFAVLFKTEACTVARTVIVGAMLSYVFWSLFFAYQATHQNASFIAEFIAQFRAPWWAWPALIAPFAAFTVTYFAASKIHPRAAEA